MKIVLIEPRATQANVYSKMHMPLIGPILLGTILKNRGHQVEIYNEEIYTPDYSTIDADLVGVSILTSTANRGYEIARKFPKEKVIMGGVHASLMPDEALKYCRQVVAGEAEEVIVDVAEGRRKEPVVAGVAVQDLDTIPFPDFSLIKGLYIPSMVMPISTSRGCPFDCSFCSVTKMFGRKYRFRSAENVMAELDTVVGKVRQFFFCDDNFTANTRRARRLLNIMRKQHIGRWSCQVRCDAARHPDMLNLMYKAGCRVVCVGLESINHKTLKAYQKNQTVEDIVQAVDSFHEKGLQIHGMFVLGGDDDDAGTVKETERFARKHGIDSLQMMILTPLPGTRTYDDLDKQKRIFSKDWDLYDGQHVVFHPKLLSALELQRAVFRAYAGFYALYRSIEMFLRLKFRNALVIVMGHGIVKEWQAYNRGMSWLPEQKVCCPQK